ncbi:MAG: SUMF1/EgtB/PvdO family nonheme iron enzyme [Myxococcota bacterium]
MRRLLILSALLPALPLLLGGDDVVGVESAPDPTLAQRQQRPEVVWIEPGWFIRGSNQRAVWRAVSLCTRHLPPALPFSCQSEEFVVEQPQVRVYVSRFGIDRTEVTWAAYRRCVLANRCPPPFFSEGHDPPASGGDAPDPSWRETRLALDDHPVVGVTWGEAQRFCEFVGGRLPTEAEWERAARGSDSRTFPWGRYYNPRLANHGDGAFRPDLADGFRYAAPVGSYPDAVSPYGLLDMAGNAFEWTSDRFAEDAYSAEGRVDPEGPVTGGYRVIRGGSWQFPPFALRVSHRAYLGEGEHRADVGFRCAYEE